MASLPAIEPASTLDIPGIVRLLRSNARRVNASSADERIEKLRRLERVLMRGRDEIRQAMWDDFKKPPQEVDLSEIYPCVSEARHARRHLRKWTGQRRVPGRLALLGASSHVIYQPKGVVLIISPWNFPFNLSLGPLASAVAAGNCVVLKPSEQTPASSACMKRLLGRVFDESEVVVVEGEADVSEALLKERFDHIFFTGSPAVGRIVMKAAAQHLTSVTLELGGKSPLIVHRSADLELAARRIAWGKMVNSGQTCIAPDYLLVDEEIREVFVEKLRKWIDRTSKEGRSLIVNERHGRRVRGLFDSAMASGAKIVAGGTFGDDGRTVALTVLSDVDESCSLMKEEIFGPILPMVTFKDLDDAVAIIARRESPLVLYLFARDREFINGVVGRTSAGGTAINQTLIHFFQLNLPFGGIGESGMGKGHGFAGFEAFSNARGVLEQKTPFSAVELLYPPYTALKKKFIDFTVRFL